MADVSDERGTYIYLMVLDQAFDDDVITSDEAVLLEVIADSLNLDENIRQSAWRTVMRDGIAEPSDSALEKQEGEIKIYEQTVRAALTDSRITGDEYAILGRLRGILNISESDHQEMEERIRNEIDETDSLFQYLDEFNTELD
tara:strand:- start:96 stop:524 length:429 start_codon:yes stop_codon:yes gene_type:complete